MAEISPHATDSSVRHRQLYKMTTPPWKEAYRDRCLRRFRRSRERLVDSFRKFSVDNEVEESSSIPEIMNEEWQGLQNEKIFDGNEFIDELSMVQHAILQELLAEEQLIAAEYEASMQLEQRINDSIIMDTESDVVLCPLCQKRMLQQTAGIVHCSCGLSIDTEDGISLARLQEQMTNALQIHNRPHVCRENPVFSLAHAPGITNLLLSCQTCGFCLIII